MSTRGVEKDYSLIFQIQKHADTDGRDYRRLFRGTKNGNLAVDAEIPAFDGDGEVGKSIKLSAFKLCGVLNKAEDAVVTFHDGNTDDNCQFNGHHWHIVSRLLVHPTRDSRWGRSIVDMGAASGLIAFRSEAARDVGALCRHIATSPRLLVWKKGERYESFVEQAEQINAMDQEERPQDWNAACLREDKNFFRVMCLKNLMSKYDVCDPSNLRQKLMGGNRTDYGNYTKISCLSNFDTMFKKAKDLYLADEVCRPLESRFESLNKAEIYPQGNKTYLSLLQSRNLMDDWIHFQAKGGAHLKCGVDDLEFTKVNFVKAFFDVLTRKKPKINTVVLMGRPNSGKSWAVRSLIPLYPQWGEVRGSGSYNFMWEGCLDKAVIICEEPMFETATIEHAKQVLEGAQTQINVKNKCPHILQPTPVIITTNNDVWKWCPEAKSAIQARCYYMSDLKSFPSLKNVTQALNPHWWQEMFELHYTESNDDWMTAVYDPPPGFEDSEISDEACIAAMEEVGPTEKNWAPCKIVPCQKKDDFDEKYTAASCYAEMGSPEIFPTRWLNPFQMAQEEITRGEYINLICTQEDSRYLREQWNSENPDEQLKPIDGTAAWKEQDEWDRRYFVADTPTKDESCKILTQTPEAPKREPLAKRRRLQLKKLDFGSDVEN